MTETQGLRFPLLETGFLAAVGGTYDEIVFGPVPSGHLWEITRATFEDETTAVTSARGYLGGLGEELYFWEQDAPQAGVLYWDELPVSIPEGRSYVVRFYGATALDVLKAHLIGYDLIQPKGGPHA